MHTNGLDIHVVVKCQLINIPCITSIGVDKVCDLAYRKGYLQQRVYLP